MNQINPVYQTEKLSTLKDTYVFAKTSDLVDNLAKKGWNLVDTKVASVRNRDRDGFQRHIVRFENPMFPSIPGLSDDNAAKPQIIGVNSHDGGTAQRLMLGLWRIACLNGIIAGTGLREFRAVHSGNLAEKIGGGIEFITEGIPEMIKQIQQLQQSSFTSAALEQLTKTLVDERLKHVNLVSVNYDSAAVARRVQDKSQDAFTVFNRLQETLMRGGIKYVSEHNVLDKDGNVTGTDTKNMTTRKLSSIPQAIKLNRMAYDLAVQLAA